MPEGDVRSDSPWHLAVAEAVGTASLLFAIVGSGITADRLAPGQVGLGLLINATAIVVALAVLISVIGPLSGAHFNPAVTVWAAMTGRLPGRRVAPYLTAQVAGAAGGAVVANLCFGLAPATWATTARTGPGQWLSEVLGTLGLLAVVGALGRLRHRASAPLLVAGYVGAAILATSSTAFINPAVTLARTLTDTFSGIAPSSAPGFIAAQLLAVALAVGSTRVTHRRTTPRSSDLTKGRP
ncbi:MAG: aquaporin [Acidimicrobiales bacterium]